MSSLDSGTLKPASVPAFDSSREKVKRVLITNDDGIDAPGIQLLIELAADLAEEVWVVAPDQDQSGTAQSLSLHQPLRRVQRDERTFALRGTPADCVLVGMFELMPEKPDLVLSGINQGINIADAVGFSGTLGAAMTAALFDVPSIALSQAWKDRANIPWDTARQFAPGIIQQLLSQPLPKGTTTNINFPSVTADRVVGMANASMNGQSLVGAKVISRTDQRAQPYYWLSFQHEYGAVRATDTDVNILRERCIAISFIERQPEQGLNAGLFQRFEAN